MGGLMNGVGGLTIAALITGMLASGALIFKIDFNSASGLFKNGLSGLLGTGNGQNGDQPDCQGGYCFQNEPQVPGTGFNQQDRAPINGERRGG